MNDTQRIKNQIKETEQEIEFRQFMLRMQKGNLRAAEVLNDVKKRHQFD